MDQFFRTQPHMGALYSVMDLANVTFHGDSKMADFRFAWGTILEGMPQRLDDAVLEKLLAEKLSSSTALKGDLEHYYRTEASHDDKNYTFLRRAMDQYLERKQQEKNREDTRQMWKNKAFQPLQGSAPVVDKAAPAKAKPKAKDGRDRSPSAGGKPTSKGKGSTKGDASQHIAKATDGAGQMFCWFFHHSPDGCRRGKDCLFSHQTPKKEVL
ncbi:MAG: hypothetical protein GY768_31685, partial [Planctomycetaceae bacterium]|nr:hypothetical protein [Planctomycetaceae bacterium]